MKEKEKDLEKAEERGNALIQDKKGGACSVVKETLKGLNQSWAHLDHMVSFSDPLSRIPYETHYALKHFICHPSIQLDKSDEGEPAVGAGAMDAV